MILLFCAILVCLLLLGEPLYLLIGGSAILCFLMFSHLGFGELASPLLERIRSLADQQVLLAIPFFMLSGNIMSAGDISKRLIRWAKALVGWLPGGIAVSGIGACLLFASITGSSTATLVAIGGLVYPALMKERYRESFSIGLVTTAGSIGILVPPSIPMIIYCLFNNTTKLEVEKLWLAGTGPALLIAFCLGGYSMLVSARDKNPRYKFTLKELGDATRDGFWALMLPGLVLGGIYFVGMTATEAAAASSVYALLVEIYFHGGMKWRDVPRIFTETMTLVGSFLIIIVMAMGLGDFFTEEGIPDRAALWIAGMALSPFWFLLAVDLLLLVVGCLMDIMSALMVFVPLIAPMAAAVGIDPIHLGIVFIVNLEIGYLTPPVGLNLFLSASLFKKSFGQVMRYTAPFVLLMMGCLAIVTWVPKVSLFLVEWVYDYKPLVRAAPVPVEVKAGDNDAVKDAVDKPAKVKSMKELMDADDEAPPAEKPSGAVGAVDGGAPAGRVKSMKELMEE
ncbi:MAG: TRAP transporter large permease subunit [Myxococcales bacterium]|nr:TRAP transporter large permease subunit [Myxococcales bacterium]